MAGLPRILVDDKVLFDKFDSSNLAGEPPGPWVFTCRLPSGVSIPDPSDITKYTFEAADGRTGAALLKTWNPNGTLVFWVMSLK